MACGDGGLCAALASVSLCVLPASWNSFAARNTGLSLSAPSAITPSRRSAMSRLETTLFFFSGWAKGGMLPVRRISGVCPGFATREERELAAVATSRSLKGVAGRPLIPKDMVGAGDGSPLSAMVDCGFPASPDWSGNRAGLPATRDTFESALPVLCTALS